MIFRFHSAAALVSLLFFVTSASCTDASEIIPEKLLRIEGPSVINSPQWRRKWTLARKAVQSGSYRQAASLYAGLLNEKPNLETALWEYCQLLVLLGEFQQAEKEVEHINTLAPDTPQYQLLAGKIAISNGKLKKAVHCFGTVLETASNGRRELVEEAVKGLAESLRLQGKKELSLALEEQQMSGKKSLLQISDKPNSHFSRLLNDILALKDRAKARWVILHFSSLRHFSSQQLRAVLSLLIAEKKVYREKERRAVAKIYEELLQRVPQNQKVRRQYISFLQANGEAHKALQQTDLLLEQQERGDLLLSAASFAVRAAGVPAKALDYYKRYLVLHPEDDSVRKKVIQLHKRLAKDFLPLAKSDGCAVLWQDMADFGSSRQEILLQMAEILKRKADDGDLQLAATILRFLLQKGGNYRVSLSLADVYMRLQMDKRASSVLKSIVPSIRRTDFYEKSAELLLRQGDEKGAIEAYSVVLKKNPQKEEIRNKVIVLCDALGLVNRAKDFFAFYNTISDKQKKRRPQLSVILTHLYFLGENRQSESLQEMADWAATLWQDTPQAVVAIRLEEARALHNMGLWGAAEQLLREQLNKDVSTDSVLLSLAETAADRGRRDEMNQWLDLLAREDSALLKQEQRWGKALVQARFFLRKQNPEKVTEFLTAVLAGELAKNSKDPVNWRLSRAAASLCRLGQQVAAEEVLSFCRLAKKFPIKPWGDAPASLYDLEKGYVEKRAQLLSTTIFTSKESNAQKLWDATEKALYPFKERLPSSILVTQLLIDSAIAKGEYTKAEHLLDSLGGDEAALCRERIFIADHAGKVQDALSQFYTCYGGAAGDDTAALAAHLFTGGQPEEAVLFARLLWRTGRYEDSLAAYRSILAIPVAERIFNHYNQQKKDEFSDINQEKSFWDFLSVFRFLKEQQRQSYKALLSPLLLENNRGNSVGVMLAGNFHQLSLQKILLQEYDARTASYEKRFLYAEKSYRNLLQEEGASDAAGDLAAIYERTGQYQKEARLYRQLEESGQLNAELEKSMERNSYKIAPSIITDFSFMQKERLASYQNIERQQIAGLFNYLLDLEKGLHFYYFNQHYSAPNGDKEIDVNQAGVDINWQFMENSEFSGGFSVDAQDGDINLLWHGRIDSQLDDLITGFVGIKRERIADTTASIEQMEMEDDILLGLLFDTSVGMNFGGDLQFKVRSDSNNGREFHGFVGCTLFYERSTVGIRYDFYHQDNDKGNLIVDSDFYQEPITSYWSPEENSTHRIASHFRHTFLSFWQTDAKELNAPAYMEENFVAAEVGTGVESGGHYIYFIDFDISLEISPYCLLKGSFDFLSGDERDETNVSVAIEYRW